MNDILTVSGLNKSYGDFSLKDVTFSLPEGVSQVLLVSMEQVKQQRCGRF